MGGEELGDGGGLEGVGPVGGFRGGAGAEEEERGDHQVEVAGERPHLRRPLPRGVRPKPVDQHHHRPTTSVARVAVLLAGGGWRGEEEGGVGPEVERGVGVDGGGARPEPRGGEGAPEHGVQERHHAQPHRCESFKL